MSDHIYKHLEITGSSTIGSDEAINNAIARVAETVNNLDWFVVTETRGEIANGKISHWQVTLKIGFRLEG